MNKTASILVVDDDPAIRQLLSQILCTSGYEVWEAATGQQGLQLTRERRPDLVLLDVRLPDLSGIEVCRRIKADGALADVFVVLVSGEATSTAHKVDGLEIGADDYVTKPVELNEFLARIRTILRLRDTTVALRASEQHYRQLVEILPEAVGLIDLEGRFLGINSQTVAMLGYAEAGELLGKSLFDLVPAEAQERLRAGLGTVLRTGSVRNLEATGLRKNGTCLPVELSDAVLRGAHGQPIEIVGVARDLTERKRAERQSTFFSLLGYRLSAAIAPEGAAGIILEVAQELFGWDAGYVHLYSPAEDKIIPVLTFDTLEGQRQPIRPASSTLEPSPLMRLILEGGAQLIDREDTAAVPAAPVLSGGVNRRSASMMYVPIHSSGAVVGILSLQSYVPRAYSQEDLRVLRTLADHCGNALQRIKMADALREAEAKYRGIYENASEGIFQTTPEGRILSANPALARMLGYQTAEQLTSSVTDVERQLHVAPERWQEFKRLVETQGQVRRFELEVYHKDGSKLWVSMNARAVRDESGAVQYYEGTNQDITDQKNTQQRLADTLELNQAILKGSSVGIAAYLASGRCVFANEAMGEIVNASREQLLAQNFREIVTWENCGLLKMAEQTLRRRQAHRGQIHYVTGAGKEVWLDCQMAAFVSGGELHLLVLNNDITERKRLEHAILEVSEREQRRIGQDIHDGLCQQLFSTAMACNLLRQDLAAQSRPEAAVAAKILTQINNGIAEARSLARGLSLSHVAREGLAAALQDLAHKTNHDFRVSCVAECPDCLSVSDPVAAAHLYRIASEAVHNAVKHARPRQIVISLTVLADTACLCIADDGIGIDVGQAPGAGLGLEMMRHRADIIGGELSIQRGQSGGTKVSCRFPRSLCR